MSLRVIRIGVVVLPTVVLPVIVVKSVVVLVVEEASTEAALVSKRELVVGLGCLAHELTSLRAIFDLNERIVQWYPIELVFLVDVNSEVDQELLGFKSGVSSSARHVDCLVEQVPAVIVA